MTKPGKPLIDALRKKYSELREAVEDMVGPLPPPAHDPYGLHVPKQKDDDD